MVEWVIFHRKAIMYSVVASFGVIFGVVFFYNKFQPHTQGEYLAAHQHFQQWSQGQENDPVALSKLEKVLSSHAEISPEYDGVIGERLLVWGQSEIAKKYLQKSWNRTRGGALYYLQFSKNSLQIAEGNFKEALEGALELHEEMTGDPSLFLPDHKAHWEGLLYAFNLVRIGMLEQKVGSQEGELKAWNTFMALQEKDPEAFLMLQHHFRDNQLTLVDYIHHRFGISRPLAKF